MTTAKKTIRITVRGSICGYICGKFWMNFGERSDPAAQDRANEWLEA